MSSQPSIRPLWNVEAIEPARQSTLMRLLVTWLFLIMTASSPLCDAKASVTRGSGTRAQLSIGYTLLFQEADAIPKFKWILMFKDKPEEMGRVTNDVVAFYQNLADTMRRLSKLHPAMRIDVTTMSKIEADVRKSMGEDMAKELAPLVGKTGVDFERQVLLLFYDTLDEQRHLVAVMLDLETEVGLRKFLETTKVQLDERYSKIATLLNRRYFIH